MKPPRGLCDVSWKLRQVSSMWVKFDRNQETGWNQKELGDTFPMCLCSLNSLSVVCLWKPPKVPSAERTHRQPDLLCLIVVCRCLSLHLPLPHALSSLHSSALQPLFLLFRAPRLRKTHIHLKIWVKLPNTHIGNCGSMQLLASSLLFGVIQIFIMNMFFTLKKKTQKTQSNLGCIPPLRKSVLLIQILVTHLNSLLVQYFLALGEVKFTYSTNIFRVSTIFLDTVVGNWDLSVNKTTSLFSGYIPMGRVR